MDECGSLWPCVFGCIVQLLQLHEALDNITWKMWACELDGVTKVVRRPPVDLVDEVMRRQRLFWRTKEMLMKQKYQNQINLMKKQLSNNAYLWDQMGESEKRETILKQELLFTQQSLSAAEKVIEKL